ncbi:MAG: 6-pyruvoyl-tetrahydropterin synthase-related protein [Desulfuromonadaceae bacterium]|nr:6-pyruvoyl-tetrahydropterin synthase-related protein [Desulfuromonadaceae bacterium]
MTKRTQLLADIAVVILFAGLTAAVLGIRFLNSPNTPTGGDAASHVLYAWEYGRSLLFSGKILPWMPEVFAGFPFLSYYFPLPFIVIATLSKCIGFAPAFKWGSFAAALLLPGAVHVAGRRWFALPWPAAILGAMGAFAFLLHEQNSIWGGNLLSLLSGEFAYSYGVLFALLACFAWARAGEVQGGWIIAALLEAATGFSHGFTLLVVGFSTLLLLVETGNLRRTVWMLLRGHLLAFCLLGGWLWPMLEMHGITIPNDASFPMSRWSEIFPLSLCPVYLAGVAALPFCLLNLRLRDSISPLQARAMRYLAGSAALACLGFLAGDQIGLANIRFFPMVWLFCAIICGWLVGFAVAGMGEKNLPSSAPSGHLLPVGEGENNPLSHRERVANGRVRGKTVLAAQTLLTLALTLGMLGWLAQSVQTAPHWALWNHAGLESKPQWHNLSRLFPAMRGSLWSPRMVFEHDPANSDIGSTRTLEALPMFIGGRPVLEGLYMESALVGPAVYQLQSELSAQPSSPLVRFPSGALDPDFAAEHMRFMHADTVLLRSKAAQSAVEKCGLFQKVAEAPPFALYRLREFSSSLAEVVTGTVRSRPIKGWMDDAFAWFRTRSRFGSYLPVYGAGATISTAPVATAVREVQLERHRMHFETDAVGKAHLIKMAWHPRWQLRSAGELFIAGPGFMLVVPQERDIILEYGHTTTGYAGMAATAIAAAVLLLFWLRRRKSPAPVTGTGIKNRSVPFIAYMVVIALACLWFATQTPEKAYMLGHKALQAGRHDEAATQFQSAFKRRHAPAKKEEALFWLAKAEQLAGHKEEALKRYLELVDNYHGFWVPESLYSCVLLGRETGQGTNVEQYAVRLKEEYPNSSWTGKLKEMNKEQKGTNLFPH